MNYQIIKFGVVGLVNNLVNFLIVIFASYKLSLDSFRSASLGFIAGALVSYLLNAIFTFKRNPKSSRRFLYFILLQITILLIFSSSVYILNIFTNNIVLSWLFAVMLIFMMNYQMQKIFIFK